MNIPLYRRKVAGQSIPLIALMVVVLFGIVGLSVDVGNTYAEQRSSVRAINAASLAAMNKLVENGSDEVIGNVIRASLESNGLTVVDDPTAPVAPGQRRLYAHYLDSRGNPLLSCTVGNCGIVPTGVTYIRLQIEGDVSTYFARVVGRPTLPVKATAYVARCSPTNGVYPIAVNSADIGPNGFLPPNDSSELQYYGVYKDANYPLGKPQRRIFLKDYSGAPGSFSFLRWLSDPSSGSAKALADMLKGDGNIDQGFQEVDPWPDPQQAAITGYPIKPGQLNPGDWIYGNSGWSASNGPDGVQAALQEHITKGTVMILPIVDSVVGNGNNVKFKLNRLGKFYLRGVTHQGGNNAYFDLVYLGDANETACLTTPAHEDTVNSLGLIGSVFVNPRWMEEQEPAQPISYEIVLDVSGSMSWNFAGQAGSSGSTIQCGYNPSIPNQQCGVNDFWSNVSERRIYIAKQAINGFIDLMNTNDTMRIIGFSGAGIAANTGWSSDKAKLKNDLLSIGAYNSDPYRTKGGTPGADAIEYARQLLQTSNGAPVTAPNGKDYKRVVLYLTDGVANYFLAPGGTAIGSVNTATDICSGDPAPTENPTCQIGTTSGGKLRPISAMVDQAKLLKQSDPLLTLFVVALAGVPETGLDQVASSPSLMYPATDPNIVDDILREINAKSENSTCLPAGGFTWVNSIDGSHTADAAVTSYPNGTYGYVFLYQQDGITAVNAAPDGSNAVPIVQDPSTGKLSFSVASIGPGVYQMQAEIAYKGEDGKSRFYKAILDQSSLKYTTTKSFTLNPSDTLGKVVPIDPVFLDLQSNIDVCK